MAAVVLAGASGLARADEAVDFWKDPEFQKRFLGTYGVLGDVEPRVSPEERAQLETIIPLMSSDLVKAAADLAAMTTPQSSALFDFTLGNIHFQLDRMEEAERGYRAAVEKSPSFLRAHKNLGLVSVRTGKMAQAVKSFSRMVELGGGDGLTYGLMGHAYASLQQFVPAEAAYRQAMMLQPETLDWRLGLARCLFRQQKFAEAAALSGEMIETHPDRVEFWQLQASAFIGLKEPLKAAQNYEVLARMGKATVETFDALGDIYLSESLPDLATRAYLSAIALDPQQTAGRPMRAAELLASRGALAQSKQVAVRIKEVYGDRLDAADQRKLLKLQARIALTDGESAESVKALEEVVALDPLDGEALMLLAQRHARAGETEKAIFYYERAESLESFEADAKVRHAQLLVGQSKYQDAAALLRRAQELRPRDEVARYLDQVERIARTQRWE